MLDRITPKMREAVDYMLAHPNASQKQIADGIGKHYNTINVWLHNDMFLEYYDSRLAEEWKNSIRSAQRRMNELAKSNDEKIAIQANKYILDSGGFSGEQKINVSGDMNYTVDYGDEDEGSPK